MGKGRRHDLPPPSRAANPPPPAGTRQEAPPFALHPARHHGETTNCCHSASTPQSQRGSVPSGLTPTGKPVPHAHSPPPCSPGFPPSAPRVEAKEEAPHPSPLAPIPSQTEKRRTTGYILSVSGHGRQLPAPAKPYSRHPPPRPPRRQQGQPAQKPAGTYRQRAPVSPPAGKHHPAPATRLYPPPFLRLPGKLQTQLPYSPLPFPRGYPHTFHHTEQRSPLRHGISSQQSKHPHR